MICPACHSGNEMAYSVLSHGFVCLESECGFELEMEEVQAREVLEPTEDLVACLGVKLLLFDIDQTLINTGGAGLRALDRACEKLLSLRNAMGGISPHGKTDPAIAREILRVRLGITSPAD